MSACCFVQRAACRPRAAQIALWQRMMLLAESKISFRGFPTEGHMVFRLQEPVVETVFSLR